MNPEVLTRETVLVPIAFGTFLLLLALISGSWLWVTRRAARRRARERPDLTATQRRALERAINIVGFAVGNCSYYETRGWPHDDLRALTEHLHELGLLEVDTRRDWLDFAQEAAAAERMRAAKPRERKMATGADWDAARERFEQEFRTGVDTYKKGGLTALVDAKKKAAEPEK